MKTCSVLQKVKETHRYLPNKYVGKQLITQGMNQYLLDFKLKYNNVLFILSVFHFRELLLSTIRDSEDIETFQQKMDIVQNQMNLMKQERNNNEFNNIIEKVVKKCQVATIIQKQQNRKTDNQLSKCFQQFLLECLQNDVLRLDMIDMIKYMLIQKLDHQQKLVQYLQYTNVDNIDRNSLQQLMEVAIGVLQKDIRVFGTDNTRNEQHKSNQYTEQIQILIIEKKVAVLLDDKQMSQLMDGETIIRNKINNYQYQQKQIQMRIQKYKENSNIDEILDKVNNQDDSCKVENRNSSIINLSQIGTDYTYQRQNSQKPSMNFNEY